MHQKDYRILKPSIGYCAKKNDAESECCNLEQFSHIYYPFIEYAKYDDNDSFDYHLYSIHNAHEVALEYLKQSLNLAKRMGAQDTQSRLFLNMGHIYLYSFHKYDFALDCLEQAFNIAQILGSQDIMQKSLKYMGVARSNKTGYYIT